MATDLPDPLVALQAYDLGQVRSLTPAGGTAGRTWRVDAELGTYFLRLRGIRTSGASRLRFDHDLRDHLSAAGVPTVAAVRSRQGERWQRCAGRVFELYPFVNGGPFRPEREHEVAAAARVLARFHLAAAAWHCGRPPAEEVAQYTTLGYTQETSTRLDDPRLQDLHLRAVRDLAGTRPERDLVERCRTRVAHLKQVYDGPAYAELTGWVVHGDFTPANLLFAPDGQVVGLFDLDWALPGSRCRDLADGLFFFAAAPRPLDGADIWSLTEAADFDLERGALFLSAYQSVSPLRPAELAALPAAFAARWLSIRLEGMAKVPPSERFRFFARDLEEPLSWLDAHFAALVARLHGAPVRET